MIVVTGASGQLGHAIVEKLVERVPAQHIAANSRDPDKAKSLARLGVRLRAGDFSQPESLSHAFEGATQVLIVSSNARATGGDTLAQHRAAIVAARAAGARRIVYTSHMACSATSAFPPMHDHAATEAMLADSGVAWTSLRHGFYASSGIMLMGDALNSGVIETPADGRISWTAHADLAEVAAIVLANEGLFDGPTPPLTGSEALNFDDVAKISSEVLGKPVIHKTLTNDELKAKIAARGLPDVVLKITLGLYAASRNGEFSTVDPTLEKLLKRKPITMRDLLAEKIKS
jgi:NAD(P)H dehydrogenase (quinone)